jgi:hypothetical protein
MTQSQGHVSIFEALPIGSKSGELHRHISKDFFETVCVLKYEVKY